MGCANLRPNASFAFRNYWIAEPDHKDTSFKHRIGKSRGQGGITKHDRNDWMLSRRDTEFSGSNLFPKITVFRTLISTSFIPTSGSGTSSNRSPLSACALTRAFISSYNFVSYSWVHFVLNENPLQPALSLRSIAFDVGVIDNPPLAVQQSS